MIRCAFLGCLLLVVPQLAAQDILGKLSVISKSKPEIKKLGVIYNSTTMEAAAIPNGIGDLQIVKIPIADMRELGPALNTGLKKFDIQAIFLLDDGQKLVTNGRTVRYILKQGLKREFQVFSDAENLEVKVTGKIVLSGGQLQFDLGEDQ